jgi:hyperosmotically inducible periplasmic protein
MRKGSAFLIGAGAAYFLDPQQGRRRRSMVRDRSLAFVRRVRRVGIGKLKLVGGHARGVQALVARLIRRPRVATDDETVTQRIRSDAFRDVGVSTREVDVDVENGVAKLRGEVEDDSLAVKLVERVRKVPGVKDVSTELAISKR